VWLDDGGRKAGRKDELEGDGALVEALGDQVRYLKEQRDIRTEKLREHRRLLGGLIERMLELEGPVGCQAFSEPRGGCSGVRGGRAQSIAPPV